MLCSTIWVLLTPSSLSIPSNPFPRRETTPSVTLHPLCRIFFLIKRTILDQIQTTAVVWDDSLGGRDFDRCLASHFLQIIKEKHGLDLSNDPKAMAKLLKEAEKVKTVLRSLFFFSSTTSALTPPQQC
jgi:hypothetical protein